jgi:hypothetical protein
MRDGVLAGAINALDLRYFMFIPITPIKQDTPYACATACLQVILEVYGVNASRREIEEFLKRLAKVLPT